MNAGMIEPRHWVLAIFIVSALYVHFRGTVRFGLVRALTDFTVLLAPVNAVMYLFSRTRRTAYIDPSEFPELAPLQANWQIIRDEAMALATKLSEGPTVSYSTMKANIQTALDGNLSQVLLAEAEGQRVAGASEDAREGGLAFLQKRKAEFKGR